ncbi:helix-hairpin-helix domain-containing protein [Thorsellia anophelis]|uniref:Protein kinase domain-containing protein n=1 Tax=Thorsellia anophelis DSM 18579 TaxID=1123402 RepID=A0A1I0ENF4_9GAMM|nr:serine/threonine-protein kinase [Thorsellia anophelis]SET46959.1 Protein kinase domain-containing protein [Thorsellia anophelis DSM 18579]
MSNTQAQIITLTASDGSTIRFYDEVRAQGAVKDVMFSPDKEYVIAFFRDKADEDTRERLLEITGRYRENIFNQIGGEYLKNVYCWPTAVVEYNQRLGVVVPFYRDCFFFKHGSKNNDMLGIINKEKIGKWFASPKLRQKFLDPKELGNWMSYLKISLMLSRAIRRMHMAGLSHSDLGYNNCLIDPITGQACLIDIDGLVVPGKHPPSVIGTPDFIAPEVVKTAHLNKDDPNKKFPSRMTDLHALAVMIYLNLLYRHPLRGDKVHDAYDAEKDESLMMGENACFIENVNDTSNRVNPDHADDYDLPWKDTNKIPYTVTGPYLSKLFEQAFIDGLHDPLKRPSADEWETALIKSIDLLQPCHNDTCTQKWYLFDNSTSPKCPFCGTPHKGKLPILNLYSSHAEGKYLPDNHRIMVYSEQSLYRWHENRLIFPNEKLTASDTKRIGYFIYHENDWYLVNEGLTKLKNITHQKDIAIGEHIKLEDGLQLLLSPENGGRLVVIQMAGE